MKLFSRTIIVVLVLALLLRIIVVLWSFNFRENTDTLRYRDWGRISYLYGLSDTYSNKHLSFGTLPNNQPPGSLYTILGMYNLSIQTSKVILRLTKSQPGSLQWINGPLLDFFLRLPSLLADVVIGYFIYKLVRTKSSEKLAVIASCLFLFNPAVLYNSAFWGQMDSINNLFMLVAIYLLYKQKIELVLPFVLLSLFVKLSLLPLLTLFIIVLFLQKNKDLGKILVSIIISIVLIIVLTLPISSLPFSFIFSFMTSNGIGEMQNITAFAFNFWWVLFKPTILIGPPTSLFSFSEVRLVGSPFDSLVFFGFRLFEWALILFFVFLLPVIVQIFKNRDKILKVENLFLIFSIATLLMFLILPRMHERYVYPVLPLLSVYFGLTRKSLLTYVALSIFSFINLYIVWHPMTLPLLTYQVIKDVNFQWVISIAILITGSIFYFKSLKILMKV